LYKKGDRRQAASGRRQAAGGRRQAEGNRIYILLILMQVNRMQDESTVKIQKGEERCGVFHATSLPAWTDNDVRRQY